MSERPEMRGLIRTKREPCDHRADVLEYEREGGGTVLRCLKCLDYFDPPRRSESCDNPFGRSAAKRREADRGRA